ncbi:MAG: NAD+ synthase [Gammaproteobacteria bacterium]|nr:NAD+ synthase [Gammaproteobacteria bacterium]
MKIALAQINLLVGDVPGNVARMLAAIDQARAGNAELVAFPELALCGYPPEDLLFHAGLREDMAAGLERIKAASGDIAVVIGYPHEQGGRWYNAAALLHNGRLLLLHRKNALPNYGVFDERRYFSPGEQAGCAEVRGMRVGLAVCEDVWGADVPKRLAAGGAQLILAINGSPYELAKQMRRETLLAERARETGLPLAYVNLVGGQDELVFDGGSCVMDASGQVRMRAKAFEEGLYFCGLEVEAGAPVRPRAGIVAPLMPEEAEVYEALVTGIRDYVRKSGFSQVVLGLSGGIDSALTLALAVDALGPDRVLAVMMPYRYTSAMSLEDAKRQAKNLGSQYEVLPITGMVETMRETLAGLFAGMPEDVTEENMQSRCRGMLLMAISNKHGRLVLATGNKSEYAVGYATLYGDMAGGFAPLKDCTKSRVYRLARYRNALSKAIPERVLERAPTAELRPDQLDSDSLPPYEVLDEVLDALMMEDLSAARIAARGFDAEVVRQVLDRVRSSEHKRRQAPPGVRVTERAFGRDWRYPIVSGYRPGRNSN